MSADPVSTYLSGCAHREPRAIDLTGVSELEVKGHADVHVVRGPPAVHVGAPTGQDAAAVVVERRARRLVIEFKGARIVISGAGTTVIASGKGTIAAGRDIYIDGERIVATGGVVQVGPAGPLVVVVSMPELSEACVSGSGDLQLHDVNQREIALHVDGSGDIDVDGRVESVVAEVHGSGDIDARDLQAQHANARVGGSGDVRVSASESVKARVSGSGDITVYGKPSQRDTRVNGSGDISFR
jgi:hypothetical protein